MAAASRSSRTSGGGRGGPAAALSTGLLLAVTVAAVLPAAEGARVLGLFPYPGRSHNVMFKALMEVLADHGHEVVMFSPFPQKQPRANYTDVDLSDHFPSMVNTLTYDQMTSFSRFRNVNLIADMAGADMCRAVFATRQFQDLMAGAYGRFDIVLTEIFGSDCWTAVPYKFQVPLISVVTAPDMPWMHERLGSVDNPSYLVVANEPYAGRMDLWHRLQNVVAYACSNLLHKWLIQWPSDAVVREFFGEDTPPIAELVRNTSLVLVNYHASINPARPVPPNVVHVGGLHFKDGLRGVVLEPALRAWMDGAEHGVVFFSLGSLVRSSSLPRAAIDGLLRAFAALPQRVLWKYEADDLALPHNVRTASWLPQAAVLAHPKTVLFMTHGGLMGTTEALVFGVPMIGIPLFADQLPNIEQYRLLGIAERLDHTDLTEDNVLAAIRKLTATDRYHVRAKEVAARYADRPRSAADEAAWWVDYVVRHRGAPHLRPLGADLPLYQYLLLDVAVVLLSAVVVVLVLAKALLWVARRAFLGSKRSTSDLSRIASQKKRQ